MHLRYRYRYLAFGGAILRALAAGALVITSACATTGGATGGDARARYTGQPFAVAAASDDINGQVCGMDVQYAVERDGSGVRLNGYLDARFPSQLEVREEGDARRITGTLGTQAGASVVDLVVTGESVRGRVGFREFALTPAGDELRGTMRIAGVAEMGVATVRGRAALAALPPDVQGAVVPNLLTCFVAPIGMRAVSPLVVGVGGPAGSIPRESSSLYSRR